jgi:hypothetical protein
MQATTATGLVSVAVMLGSEGFDARGGTARAFKASMRGEKRQPRILAVADSRRVAHVTLVGYTEDPS